MTTVLIHVFLLAMLVPTCQLLPLDHQRGLPAGVSSSLVLREKVNNGRTIESIVTGLTDLFTIPSGQDIRLQQTSLVGFLLPKMTKARFRSLLPFFASPHTFISRCCPQLPLLCTSADDCALYISYCINDCICPHNPRWQWCPARPEQFNNIKNKKEAKHLSTIKTPRWFDRFQKYVVRSQSKKNIMEKFLFATENIREKFLFTTKDPRTRHQASSRRHIRSSNLGTKTGSPSMRHSRSVETNTNSSLGDKSGYLSVSTAMPLSGNQDHTEETGSHTRLGDAGLSGRVTEQAPFLATQGKQLKSVTNTSLDWQENKHENVPTLSQNNFTVSSTNRHSIHNQTDDESITINSNVNEHPVHSQRDTPPHTINKSNNETLVEEQASEPCGVECILHGGKCIMEMRDDIHVTPAYICLYEKRDPCQVLNAMCLHGTCVVDYISHESVVRCKCDSGWAGEFCNASCGLDCGHHGGCELVLGHPVCVCHPNYTGEGCKDLLLGFVPLTGADGSRSNTTSTNNSNNNNSSSDSHHHHNSHNKDRPYKYSEGEHSADPCGAECTIYGGICTFDYKNFTCVYETATPCQHLNCHHGTCSSENNVHRCHCEEGWTGYRCDVPCQLDCGQHGDCDVISPRGHTICRCHENYTGVHCTDLIPLPLMFTGEDVVNDGAVTAWQITAGCLGVVAGVLVLLSLLAYVTWRKQWLPMRKFVHFFQQYEEDDGKEYDAFVSYRSRSHDEQFVLNELYPQLECHLNFKLCMHFRDFPPGETIADNIINAIENSRRTILVLSPAYVESEWCRLEFQKAQHEMLKLRHKVIPLVLEDVSHMQPMDSTLRTLLDTITYLQWPGKLEPKRLDKFWKLLELSMPKKKRDYLRSVSSTGSCSSDRPLTAVSSSCFNHIMNTMGPEPHQSVCITCGLERREEEGKGCQNAKKDTADREKGIKDSEQQGDRDSGSHEYAGCHKWCDSDGDQNSDSGCCRDRALSATSDVDFPLYPHNSPVDNANASCAQTQLVTSDDHIVEIRDCPGDNVKIVHWLPARLST